MGTKFNNIATDIVIINYFLNNLSYISEVKRDRS